jgi:hypothetical protein
MNLPVNQKEKCRRFEACSLLIESSNESIGNERQQTLGTLCP